MEKIKLQILIKTLSLLSVATVLLTVFIMPFILGLAVRYVPFGYQPPLTTTLPIYGGLSLNQEIIAQDDNFTAIGFSIKNPNLANKNDLLLSISQNGQEIRRSVVNGQIIPDGDLVKFVFSPIPNSANQIYQITLSAPDSDREKSLEIYLTDQEVVWQKNAYLDEDLISGKLATITYYKLDRLLLQPLYFYKTWFTKLTSDTGFFIFYTILTTSLLTVFILLKKKPS